MIELENGVFMEQVEDLSRKKRWPDVRDMLLLLADQKRGIAIVDNAGFLDLASQAAGFAEQEKKEGEQP